MAIKKVKADSETRLEARIKYLEEKLRSQTSDYNESRLKRAEFASGTGNWELHYDTGKIYGSEGALRLYGLKDKEMNYEDVKSIPLPEYRPILDKALEDLIAGNKPYNIEFRLKNRETGVVLDIHSTAEYDSKNKIVFGIIRDITSQKRIENELKKRSENLAIQLRISMELLENADKRSVLQSILEGTKKLVGLDTAAVYSIEGESIFLESTIPPLPDSFPEEFRKASIKNHPHIARALKEKQTLVVRDIRESEISPEEKIIIENMDMRSLLFIPLIASGRNYGIIILGSSGEVHDFTENEISICRTISNIATLALENSILISNLRAARDKAEESDRLKTAFLHNISHEIRTPLNAIIGFSGFLEQPDLPENERRKYIEIINQSNSQLLNIINDIFYLSHIEAGQVMIREEKTDIKRLLNNLYNQFLPVAEKKGLHLRLNVQGAEKECCNLISDEGKLLQVLSNLINNAIKFTPSGTVTLGCSKMNHRIRFSVEDTGIGIPEEEHERIFERFYQVERSTTRTYTGAGLGLSISDAYVKMLGGEIKVESEPGNGSCFSFEIPCIPVENISTEIMPSQIKLNLPERRYTIIIAEDESSNARLLELFLKKLNARIIIAFNGKEALDYCHNEKQVDLVLMDIKMPVMDGYTATREIRKLRPEIPVIAQTAYATTEDRLKALNAGCTDFISKPINKADLIKLVEKYLPS